MPEAALESALRAALPQGVMLGRADAGRLYPLLAGEGAGPGAVPLRRAEFSAGRAAARAAMGADLPLPMGPDRAPLWPDPMVGSIAHGGGVALAIAAKRVQYQSLGLDVEPLAPLNPALWPAILTPSETPADGFAALAHFVAKEAAYKAQYPVSRQLFDFHTLEITFDGAAFAARFTRDVGPFAMGARLQGVMVQGPAHLAALVALPV